VNEDEANAAWDEVAETILNEFREYKKLPDSEKPKEFQYLKDNKVLQAISKWQDATKKTRARKT
jgi:hypothetical protein